RAVSPGISISIVAWSRVAGSDGTRLIDLEVVAKLPIPAKAWVTQPTITLLISLVERGLGILARTSMSQIRSIMSIMELSHLERTCMATTNQCDPFQSYLRRINKGGRHEDAI